LKEISGNMMGIVLLTLLIPLIVSFVSFLAIRKAGVEKKTRSIDAFTVKCPRTSKQILLFLASMPAMIGLLLLLRFGVGEDVETGVYITLSAFSGSILLVLLVAVLQELDVENDLLTYRNFVGRKKRIIYDQIDKACFYKPIPNYLRKWQKIWGFEPRLFAR